MQTVAGIFDSRTAAENAVQQIRSLGIPNERIALLIPGMSEREIEHRVPISDTESPGEGKAMGAAVAGAIGVAGGATLGAAAASLLVPGVGPVIAGSILGAAILGAGGAVTGMAAGEALDEALLEGLPHDQLFVYEDALRKGRSVVVVFADEEKTAERIRATLAKAGGEDIDSARENWWAELRGTEADRYQAEGRDFDTDEVSYRQGFEAALHAKLRGRSFDEATSDLELISGNSRGTTAFRQGYERGLAYQRSLRETHKT